MWFNSANGFQSYWVDRHTDIHTSQHRARSREPNFHRKGSLKKAMWPPPLCLHSRCETPICTHIEDQTLQRAQEQTARQPLFSPCVMPCQKQRSFLRHCLRKCLVWIKTCHWLSLFVPSNKACMGKQNWKSTLHLWLFAVYTAQPEFHRPCFEGSPYSQLGKI